MQETELGRLIKDHLETHNQVATQRAELEQLSGNLVLLGETLKTRPENLLLGEAKLTLKAGRYQDSIVLFSELDARTIVQTVHDLSQAIEHEKELARRLRECDMGYIVDGLNNRKPASRDILRGPR